MRVSEKIARGTAISLCGQTPLTGCERGLMRQTARVSPGVMPLTGSSIPEYDLGSMERLPLLIVSPVLEDLPQSTDAIE